MKKIILIVIIVALGVFMKCNSAEYYSKVEKSTKSYSGENEQDGNITKEFKAKSGGRINMDLRAGGEINVSGWDKEIVKIEIFDEDNSAEYQFKNEDGNVEITSDFTEKRENHTNIKLEISVPENYNIEFNTLGGAVNASNIKGEIKGETMGGGLKFTGIAGLLKTKTMGGAIKIKDCNVDGEVETMGGGITLENVTGDLSTSTMGGSIKQINVKNESKADGHEVKVKTMGGEISIDEAPNGADLKTMGGNIKINYAGKHLKAETMGGKIIAEKVDGSVNAKTFGGDISVNMVGDPSEGERNVTLESLGGDVTLFVPKDLSMDVEIELAYTKNAKKEYQIISDFAINEERTDARANSKKKYIHGKGEFNGGKNKIILKTVNGNIYLKKS